MFAWSARVCKSTKEIISGSSNNSVVYAAPATCLTPRRQPGGRRQPHGRRQSSARRHAGGCVATTKGHQDQLGSQTNIPVKVSLQFYDEDCNFEHHMAFEQTFGLASYTKGSFFEIANIFDNN